MNWEWWIAVAAIAAGAAIVVVGWQWCSRGADSWDQLALAIVGGSVAVIGVASALLITVIRFLVKFFG